MNTKVRNNMETKEATYQYIEEKHGNGMFFYAVVVEIECIVLKTIL